MTVKELIQSVLEDRIDMDRDSVEKLIYVSYHMGKCEGTIKTSNAYARLLQEQKQRAKECRYHKMAMKVQGEVDYLYMPDYDNWILLFAGDETDIVLQETCFSA